MGAQDDGFPCEPESLDVVCAYSLLHLVKDRAAVLRRIHRVLRPGGFFVSSTVCLRESWVPYGVLLPVMRAFGKAPLVKVVSRRALVDDIRTAGFDVVETDVGSHRMIAFVVATKPRPVIDA